MAGGGTGGHLFPAMAIGEGIQKKVEADVHYVGSSFGIEAEKFPGLGIDFTLLPIRGLQRNISFLSIGKNALLPGRIIQSIIKTRKLFDSLKPDLIVGTGGYASAVPMYLARKQSIPYFIQEQNSFPGITTRYFSDDAEVIFTAYPEVDIYFKKKTSFCLEIQSGKELRWGIA